MRTEITTLVSRELELVDRLLEESSFGVPSADSVTAEIAKSGGKKMRPAVFLLAARALSNGLYSTKSEDMVRIAAALELIHTASLLHDDVVDGSMTRRGRPSANALFGNRASILAGDLLWCRASELILPLGNTRLMAEIVDAARDTTIGEMMCGQRIRDRGSYLAMVEGKTGSLFRAAARSAAIVAEAGDPMESALARYGTSLGAAFQIADDVIDSTTDDDTGLSGPAAVLGGTEAAIALARELSAEARRNLTPLGPSAEARALSMIADYAVDRACGVQRF
ncbi:MAG: polyprenyl synthetase family protein [Proteobacteria bacterium]|nr:polyprenyl synthetase family protein [Pseudomonadota bacterium]